MDHISKTLQASDINEISFRYSLGKRMDERPLIGTSHDADRVLRALLQPTMEAYESFWVLLLDRGNRMKGAVQVSRGGIHGTVADPKIIFGVALRTLSSGIVLAHNHPSGQMRPSQEDIHLTRKLSEGAKLLDLCVQDHIILGIDGFYSFADNGQL